MFVSQLAKYARACSGYQLISRDMCIPDASMQKDYKRYHELHYLSAFDMLDNIPIRDLTLGLSQYIGFDLK